MKQTGNLGGGSAARNKAQGWPLARRPLISPGVPRLSIASDQPGLAAPPPAPNDLGLLGRSAHHQPSHTPPFVPDSRTMLTTSFAHVAHVSQNRRNMFQSAIIDAQQRQTPSARGQISIYHASRWDTSRAISKSLGAECITNYQLHYFGFFPATNFLCACTPVSAVLPGLILPLVPDQASVLLQLPRAILLDQICISLLPR
jgi:hypothetical protein